MARAERSEPVAAAAPAKTGGGIFGFLKRKAA